MAANPPQHPRRQEVIDIDSDSSDEGPFNDTPPLSSAARPKTVFATYEGCVLAIQAVFPDISLDHVKELWAKSDGADFKVADVYYQRLIEGILDVGPYPKERDRLRDLKKRKRASPEAEAAKWKYADLRHDPEEYAKVAKARLSERFDMVPMTFIYNAFNEHSHYYAAFFAIEEAERTQDKTPGQPFKKLKTRRVSSVKSEQIVASLEAEGHDFVGLREEMRAAETRFQKKEDDRKAAKERTLAKIASDEEYRRKGETMECACCFSDDNPPTDMTHGNGDAPHFFCFACAKRNAETDMTSLKYALRCMDQSRCEATFSRTERQRFLDPAAVSKLDSLQQQDEIRRANMGDLETCPFCDYAGICPPTDVDRLFECQNEECMETSCRLCREKAHIPLTCEDFKKENGVGERHVIEEARTNALIRSCKKCSLAILKEDGCNKIVCTTCYSIICDYCGEDISKSKYDHFDSNVPGIGRAGKGKCPLYDNSNHKDERIEKAGKAAMEKVRAENPSLSEEDLKIKFAQVVEDESRRLPSVRGGHAVLLEEHARLLNDGQFGIRGRVDLLQGNAVHNAAGAGADLAQMHAALLEQQNGQREALNALRLNRANELANDQRARDRRLFDRLQMNERIRRRDFPAALDLLGRDEGQVLGRPLDNPNQAVRAGRFFAPPGGRMHPNPLSLSFDGHADIQDMMDQAASDEFLGARAYGRRGFPPNERSVGGIQAQNLAEREPRFVARGHDGRNKDRAADAFGMFAPRYPDTGEPRLRGGAASPEEIPDDTAPARDPLQAFNPRSLQLPHSLPRPRIITAGNGRTLGQIQGDRLRHPTIHPRPLTQQNLASVQQELDRALDPRPLRPLHPTDPPGRLGASLRPLSPPPTLGAVPNIPIDLDADPPGWPILNPDFNFRAFGLEHPALGVDPLVPDLGSERARSLQQQPGLGGLGGGRGGGGGGMGMGMGPPMVFRGRKGGRLS